MIMKKPAAGSNEAWEDLAEATAVGDLVAIDAALRSHGPGLLLLSDSKGRTPLLIAAGEGHAAVAAHLLARGSEADHRDKTGATALIHAAGNGHVEVVRLLLTADASGCLARHKRYDGSTALHDATGHGHLEVVEVLLKCAGAAEFLGEADRAGATPLCRAVSSGQRETAQALVEYASARGSRRPRAVVPIRSSAGEVSKLASYSKKRTSSNPGRARYIDNIFRRLLSRGTEPLMPLLLGTCLL